MRITGLTPSLDIYSNFHKHTHFPILYSLTSTNSVFFPSITEMFQFIELFRI
jgi:hypothetical protein